MDANDTPQPAGALSAHDVRKVARLGRLALTDEQVEAYRTQLATVLMYVERLRDVEVAGVEPMPHVGEGVNRLDDDVPGPTLETSVLMDMTAQTMPPFVRVPKVLGDEGSA